MELQCIYPSKDSIEMQKVNPSEEQEESKRPARSPLEKLYLGQRGRCPSYVVLPFPNGIGDVLDVQGLSISLMSQFCASWHISHVMARFRSCIPTVRTCVFMHGRVLLLWVYLAPHFTSRLSLIFICFSVALIRVTLFFFRASRCGCRLLC